MNCAPAATTVVIACHNAEATIGQTIAAVERIDEADWRASVALYSNLSLRHGMLAQFQATLAHSIFQSVDPNNSPYLGTQCAAVNRSPLVELGGFDKAYPAASVEDFEL